MRIGVRLTAVITQLIPVNTRMPTIWTPAMLALGVVLVGCKDSVVGPGPGTDDSVARDRAALEALYDATEGPSWEHQQGWSTDAPLGRWHGVVTDSVGRVTWLTLSANGLKGTLPTELGSLSELQFLGLADNQLEGPIPMELGNAPRLAGLFLKNNRLTGAIPESFLQLGQLRVLDFAGNRGLCVPGTADFVEWAEGSQVIGPDCSQDDRRALQQVFEATGGSEWIDSSGWIHYTLLEEWFGVEVDAIGRVRSLALGDNGLFGTLPEAVGELSALRSLDVGGNGLTGALPRSLTTLPLEEFRYTDTGLCVPHDEDFREWLETVDQHEGTGANCAPVAEREALIAFYKAADGPNWSRNTNWLTNAPIGEWHGVTVDGAGHVVGLSLAFNGVKGAVPPVLGSLPNLRTLELHGNWALTGPIPAEFFDLSRLRELVLGRIGLAGPLPPEIGLLTELTSLDLRSSGLGGPMPAELGELVNLEELNLSQNDLVGAIPPELGRLAALRTLALYGNELTGEIPPQLGSLTNLQILDIERNQLTGSIPGEFGNLVDLEVLWLSENKLTGAIPPAFGNMGRATRMYLHGNDLSGRLPPEMGGLTELRQLWLGNNAGLSGPLPVELKALREIDTFKAGDTGLCIPADAELMAWLDGVEFQRVARCESGAAVAAYLTQAVQSRRFPVPLVAGRPALLRVFVSSPQASGERTPPVRATFYDGDTEVHVAEIRGGSEPIPAEIDEGVMAQSANAQIPGDVIRKGLEMVIDVDPDNTLDSGLGIAGRIPEVGRIAVDVREMPDLRLTVIPFLYEARPDSSILEITAGMADDPERSEMLSRTRNLLPVGDFDVRLHDPVVTWTYEGFHLLNQIEAMRRMEGVSGYWLGMLSPVPTGGLLGVALGIRSWSSFSVPEPHIVAHELGHNMGLHHAPCGGAGGPDPLYPDRNGRIGSWGYDRERGRLVTPYTPDLMSYCHGGWIGDYHFSNSLRHRLDAEAQAAGHAVPTRTLLVWGGLDSDGDPFLEPAFLVEAVPSQPAPGSEFRLSGRTVDGGEAFVLTFDMPDIPDVDDGRSAFVFTVPATWSGTLASISLVGGGGSAILDQATDSPMTIVRDPVSGQVRAFLRGPEAAAMAVGGGEPGMETLFSRGIPDEADQRR